MSFGRTNAKRNAEQILIQNTRDLTHKPTTNEARRGEVSDAAGHVLEAGLTAHQLQLVAELVNKVNHGHDQHTQNLERDLRETKRVLGWD